MSWAVAMDWREALFLHWRTHAEPLRRLIPPDLELDLYDGEAWISIVAFRITGARARLMPPFAGLPPFDEINVRTYVRDEEKAGVWFLSLDATSRAAVWAGRTGLHLPYVHAKIDSRWNATTCTYDCTRTDRRSEARFAAEARIEPAARIAAPRTLERWLVERYCFFTRDTKGRTRRGDVEHDPWPLHDATPTITENTLLAAANVVPLNGAPLTHASSGVKTLAWLLGPSICETPRVPEQPFLGRSR